MYSITKKQAMICAVSCSVLSSSMLPALPVMAQETKYGDDNSIQIVDDNNLNDNGYDHTYNISYDSTEDVEFDGESRICLTLSDAFSVQSITLPVWENGNKVSITGYDNAQKENQIFSFDDPDGEISLAAYPASVKYIEIVSEGESLTFNDLIVVGKAQKEIVSNTFIYEYKSHDDDGSDQWLEVARQNTGGYKMETPKITTTSELFPYETENIDVTIRNLHVMGDGGFDDCEYNITLPTGYKLESLSVPSADVFSSGYATIYVDNAPASFDNDGVANIDGDEHSTLKISINDEAAFDIGQLIMHFNTNGQKSDKAISLKGFVDCTGNDDTSEVGANLNIKFAEKESEPDTPPVVPDPDPTPTPTPTPTPGDDDPDPDPIVIPIDKPDDNVHNDDGNKNTEPKTQNDDPKIISPTDIVNPPTTPTVVDNTGLNLNSLLATKVSSNPNVRIANIISNPASGLKSVLSDKIQTSDVVDLATGSTVTYGASLSDAGIDGNDVSNASGEDISSIEETTQKITDENNKKQKQESTIKKVKPQMVIIPIAVAAAVLFIALAFKKQKKDEDTNT